MIYDVYLGAVCTIFLLNAVQWGLSREWIYGIFCLQTLTWVSQTLLLRLDLDQAQAMAVHTTTNGLSLVCYLELVSRLFQKGKRPKSRFTKVQIGIIAFLLVETGLLLLVPEWRRNPVHRLVALGYWLTLTGCSLSGLVRALRQPDAVGWLFAVASTLLLLTLLQIDVYHLGTLLRVEFFPSDAARILVGQLVTGGYVVQWLCFSLCLVVRQRQLAVAQAIRQTRTEEQLAQERLQAELTQQRLGQEKAEVQLRALQSHVNPHFLFNSLNTLSSLISEEPVQAERFVDKLSEVYRYVLRANERSLTTVEAELQFINAYYHLLKTRYGSGLDMTVDVSPAYLERQLPPLTLQLLVENAVKHNVVSAKRPLHLTITASAEGFLVVQNSRQRKASPVLSNGVGLSNIMAKYQMLNLPAPTVEEAEQTFTVALKLVGP